MANEDVVFKIGSDVDGILNGLKDVAKGVDQAVASISEIKDQNLAFETLAGLIEGITESLNEAKGSLDSNSEGYKILTAFIEGFSETLADAKINADALAPSVAAVGQEAVKSQEDIAAAAAEAAAQLQATVEAAVELGNTYSEKLQQATMSGLERTLSDIDRAQQAAIEKLGEAPKGYEEQWQHSAEQIAAYFEDMRKVAEKYTGDVVRDARMRGIQTKAEIEKEAETEKKVLADMLANRDKFTKQAIEQQKKRTEAIVASMAEEEKKQESMFASILKGTLAADAIKFAFEKVIGVVKQVVDFLPSLVEHVAEVGDRFLTLNRQTGVSVEALSQWEYVAGQAGVSLDTMARGAYEMGRRLQEGGSAIKMAVREIRLNFDNLKASKPEDAFVQVFEALRKLPTAAERAAAGTAIFGSKFRQFANLAEEDIKGLMAEADKLGLTFTDAMGKAGDAFGDAQNKLANVWEGFKRQIGKALLPAATELIEGLAERFQTFLASLGLNTKSMGEIASEAVKKILALFDRLLEAIKPLIPVMQRLGNAVLEALPKFIDAFAAAIEAALPVIVRMVELIASLDPETVKMIVGLGLAGAAASSFGETLLNTSASIATIGSGFIAMGEKLNKFLADAKNASGILGTLGKAIAGVQEAQGAATALGGLTLALGPLALALVAVGTGFLIAKNQMDDFFEQAEKKRKAAEEQARLTEAWQKKNPGFAAPDFSKFTEKQKLMLLGMAEQKKDAELADLGLKGLTLSLDKTTDATESLTEAERAALIIADFKKASLDNLSAAVIRVARVGFDQEKSLAEVSKAMVEGKLITDEQTGALGRLFEAWTKAAKPLKDFKEQMSAMDAEVARAKNNKSWDELVERFGAAASKTLKDAEFMGPEFVKEISGRVLALAMAFDNKTLNDAILNFSLRVVNGVKGALVGLGTIPDEVGQKIVAGWQQQAAVMQEMADKKATIDKYGTELELAQIDIREREELKALDKTQFATQAHYEERVQFIKDGYQHERDLANETYGTIEERMRKSGVITRAEQEKNVANLKKTWQAMLQSGLYTADQLAAAWRAWQDASVALNGKWTTSWKSSLSAVGGMFEQLANIAGESMAEVSRAIGSVVSSVAGLLDGIDSLVDGFKAMKDGVSGSISGMISGMLGMIGTIMQIIDLAKQLATALTDALTRTPEEKTAADLRRQFDLKDMKEDSEFVKKITEDMEKYGVSRQDAIRLSMNEIIKQTGITADNFKYLLDRTGELLALTKKGGETGRAAMKSLDESLVQLGQHLLENGGLWTSEFINTLEEAKQQGLELSGVMQLIESQLSKATSGVAKMVSGSTTQIQKFGEKVYKDANSQAKEYQKTLEDIYAKMRANDVERGKYKDVGAGGPDYAAINEIDQRWDALNAQRKQVESNLAALQRDGSKLVGLTKEDGRKILAEYKAVTDRMAALTKERADLKEFGKDTSGVDREFDDLNAAKLKMQPTVDAVKSANAEIRANYQTEFDRVSRITLATFNSYIKQGKTAAEATEALGASIDELVQAAGDFGFEGNEAYNKLARWRELTSSNKQLIDEVSGLADVMGALSNLGGLTVETFQDLQAQGLSTFKQLQDAGFTEQEALSAMTPFLTQIIDLHRTRGLAIDDETAKMIAQAKAAGTLTDQQLSVQDVLSDGFDMVNEALIALIEALGGDVPDALREFGKATKDAMADAARQAELAAQEMQRSFNSVVPPEMEFNYGFNGAGTEPIPSFAGRPLERVTSEGLALLHPGDVVGVPQPGKGGAEPRVQIVNNFSLLDGTHLRRVVNDHVGPEMMEWLKRSGSARTILNTQVVNR